MTKFMEQTNEKKADALSVYKRIFENDTDLVGSLWESLFEENMSLIGSLPYYPDGYCTSEYFKRVKRIAEKTGAELSGLHTAAFFVLSGRMKAIYEEKAYPHTFFDGALESVIFGEHDYRMNVKYLVGALFRIGSFDFQLCENIYGDFENLKIGEPIIKMHVPKGASFDKESRYASYRAAYEFYSSRLGKGELYLVCDSWLLSHEHKENFPDSNIGDFANDFDTVKICMQEGYEGAQRIFGKAFAEKDRASLPEDTRLQRFYKKKMLCGEPLWYGVGVKHMTEEEFGQD